MDSVGLLTLSLCLTLGHGIVVGIFATVWVAKNRVESVPLLAKVSARDFVFTLFLFVSFGLAQMPSTVLKSLWKQSP